MEIYPRAIVARERVLAGTSRAAFALEMELNGEIACLNRSRGSWPARIGRRHFRFVFVQSAGSGGFEFSGEPTELVVGDENRCENFPRCSRGKNARRWRSRESASHNLFMAYSHVVTIALSAATPVSRTAPRWRGRDHRGLWNVETSGPVHQFCRRGTVRLTSARAPVLRRKCAVFTRGSRSANALLRREHGGPRAARLRSTSAFNNIESAFRLCCAPSQHSQALEQIRAQLTAGGGVPSGRVRRCSPVWEVARHPRTGGIHESAERELHK